MFLNVPRAIDSVNNLSAKYMDSEYCWRENPRGREPRACSRALSVAYTRTYFPLRAGSPWKREEYKARGGDAATPITPPLRKAQYR